MSTASRPAPAGVPTTPAGAPQHAPRPRVAVKPVTFPRVLASEWIKFRTLRSTWATLLVAIAAMIGFAALVCWATNNRWSHLPPDELAAFEPVTHSLAGTGMAQLAIAVLGVLLISGEYGTGMIRSTLAAVPHRLPVLWAKTLLWAVISFIAMLASSFAAFFLGEHLLGSHGTTIHAHGAVRAIIAVAGYLAMVGILGIAFGTIIRNTAGGIATLVGLLLVLPGLGLLLPSDWQHHILPYLPSNAGQSMYSITHDSSSLSPLGGLLCLGIWCVVSLVVAAVLLRRRDA